MIPLHRLWYRLFLTKRGKHRLPLSGGHQELIGHDAYHLRLPNQEGTLSSIPQLD